MERTAYFKKTKLDGSNKDVTSSLKKKNWNFLFQRVSLCSFYGVLWILAEINRESLSVQKDLKRNTSFSGWRLKDLTTTNLSLYISFRKEKNGFLMDSLAEMFFPMSVLDGQSDYFWASSI